jgi:putative OPT family oligopeptide transporter
MSDVSQQAPYRELTVAAVVLGVIQGVILNLAFVYAALKLGFSIGGSTVAAIMGYALLRGVMKKGTSIENNINQTIASGINTAGTGIVFTLPALFMLNHEWVQAGEAGISFTVWPFIIAGIAGSLLGVVIIIPLRKQMIDLDRLRFPSGVAVTTIIRSGASGLGKAKLLGAGFLIAALWKLAVTHIHIPGIIEHEEFLFGFGVIPAYLQPALYLSLMNVAAGLLAGRGGLAFFAGGVLAWWIISPAAVGMGWAAGADATAQAGFIYGKMLRPLGIGALMGGALMGVIMTFPAIKSAIRSLAQASKMAKLDKNAGPQDEMPFSVLIFGFIGAVILFFTAAYMTDGVTLAQALITAVVGPIWLALAALIVAQATGMTDISPMSGMALITVTIMMFILNKNIAAAMVVAVAVCVAIGQAADMMQDLKTGFMIGGRPVKQQAVQFMVTWIGVIIAIGAIYVLWESGPNGANGFGPGTSLPAPQAGVLKGIINGLKTGNVPLDKYILGGSIGAVLAAAPLSGLGVMIGLAMYLPFSITLGYGLGCLTQMWIQKKKGLHFCEHKLVPFAAGLIIGEAITGIFQAGLDILKNM